MIRVINDVRDCINAAVKDETSPVEGRLDLGSTLAQYESWHKAKKAFRTVSDPDALEMIPEIVKLFDDARVELERCSFPDEIKENAIMRLSSMRFELGVDQRERAIRGKKKDPS